mmetsp:Transcript_78606/g.230651  ORF Transcript_78606/g.230651 Transcript_78606/m.230651 type:complete len:320 (-) Transcript_78606:277-1236(-)
MSTGTLADVPAASVLAPLNGIVKGLPQKLVEELNEDPVPQVSIQEIKRTTQWLHAARHAMGQDMRRCTVDGVRAMDDAELASFTKHVRESAMRVSLLHGDSSRQFSGLQAKGAVVLSWRSQGEDIRRRLQEFSDFLNTFGESKWLGSMVEPEFQEQKQTAVTILNALQNPTKLIAVTSDVRFTPYGQVRGEHQSGEMAAADESTIYGKRKAIPSTGAGQLGELAALAEAFAAACRKDAKAHGQRVRAIKAKMEALKSFIEVLSEVPVVLRKFVLLRLGSVEEHSSLKGWVSQEEALEALQLLEQMRDATVEEKVMRRLK